MDSFREFGFEAAHRQSNERLLGLLAMRKVVIRETCPSGVEYRGPDGA
jgi:hypothetical protein